MATFNAADGLVVPIPTRLLVESTYSVFVSTVRSPEAVRLVKLPVFGVVAPTVPLILIEAVPVRLVTVPDEGVPNAPPFTTNAPDDPVLTPRAVTTPVPVVTVDGATPAPPPTTRAFAARAADDAQVVPLEK